MKYMEALVKIDSKFFWIAQAINFVIGAFTSIILACLVNCAFMFTFFWGAFIGMLNVCTIFAPTWKFYDKLVVYIIGLIIRIVLIAMNIYLAILVLDLCKYSYLYILVVVFEYVLNYVLLIIAIVRREKHWY